jgi:hypothetical protein
MTASSPELESPNTSPYLILGERVLMTNGDHSGDFLKPADIANPTSSSCQNLQSLSPFFAPSTNSDTWSYLPQINSMDGQPPLHLITSFGLEQIADIDNNFATIPFPSASHSFYDDSYETARKEKLDQLRVLEEATQRLKDELALKP